MALCGRHQHGAQPESEQHAWLMVGEVAQGEARGESSEGQRKELCQPSAATHSTDSTDRAT